MFEQDLRRTVLGASSYSLSDTLREHSAAETRSRFVLESNRPRFSAMRIRRLGKLEE